MANAPKSAGPVLGAPQAAPAASASTEEERWPELPEHYVAERVLGKGAYGKVFLCQDRRNPAKQVQVAIKWISKFAAVDSDPVLGKRIYREIRVLAALRHENLLQLIDLVPVPSPDFDDVYIVMQYMHLDLHKLIYSPKMKVSVNQVQAFVCQMLRGLKYLHSAGVVHRDLKPPNVLVNKDCSLRIADFGLAGRRVPKDTLTVEEADEIMTEYVVTRWYRAPELLLTPCVYCEAVDIWSVGCIFYELLAREPLFAGENPVRMLKLMYSLLGFTEEKDLMWIQDLARGGEVSRRTAASALQTMRTLDQTKPKLSEIVVKPIEERLPQHPKEMLELMRLMLEFDPNKRIPAADAIQHAYLAKLRDPLGELDAPRRFDWDFDKFDAKPRALKDRVYAECARLHPEIIERDAEWLQGRGFMPRGSKHTPRSADAQASAPASREQRPSGTAQPVAAGAGGC